MQKKKWKKIIKGYIGCRNEYDHLIIGGIDSMCKTFNNWVINVESKSFDSHWYVTSNNNKNIP